MANETSLARRSDAKSEAGLPAKSKVVYDENREIPSVDYWVRLQTLDQLYPVAGFQLFVVDGDVELAVEPGVRQADQYLEEFSRGKEVLKEVYKGDQQALAFTLYGLALATYLSTNMKDRESGDIYLSHLVGVSEIYLQMGMDRKLKFPGYKISPITVAACLHHDSIEDAGVTEEFIATELGTLCASRVAKVTDLSSSRLKELTREERDAVSLQKILKGAAADLHVLDIKICDRIHNFLTMDSMAPEKQSQKARWTVPLLDICRLTGMDIQELSSLVLRYLNKDFSQTLESLSLMPLEVKNYIESHVYPAVQEVLSQRGKTHRAIISPYMRLADAMEQYQWSQIGWKIQPNERTARPVIMIPFSNDDVRVGMAKYFKSVYGGELLLHAGDSVETLGYTRRITISGCKIDGCYFDVQLTHTRSLVEQLHAQELMSAQLTEEKLQRVREVRQTLGSFFSQDVDIYGSSEELDTLNHLLRGRTIVVQVEMADGRRPVLMPHGATVLDVLVHTLTKDEISQLQSFSRVEGIFGQTFDRLDSVGLELRVGPLSKISVSLGKVDTYYRPSPEALSRHLTDAARIITRNRMDELRTRDRAYREWVDPVLVEAGIHDIFASLKKIYPDKFCEQIDPKKNRGLFAAVLSATMNLKQRGLSFEEYAVRVALSHGADFRNYKSALTLALIDNRVSIVLGERIRSESEEKNHLSNIVKKLRRSGRKLCYYNMYLSGGTMSADHASYLPDSLGNSSV